MANARDLQHRINPLTNQMSDVAIGIDLGTTNSCVSIFRNGRCEIIPNNFGKRVTPSCVAFTEESGRIVGDEAKNALHTKAENFIFSAKRMIGRKYDEREIQDKMKYWPFKVNNVDSKIKISVNFRGEKNEYYPEEISSMVLNNLKQTAEDYLGTDVNNCVITVPAYFNDSQRQATIDAGKIAGLDVLRILSEPTSAAIAYNFLKKKSEIQYVLVYDFGGGTFDISILKIDGNRNQVIATGGNVDLGGEDFDNRILKYAISEFENKNKVKISDKDKKAKIRLRKVCENVKMQLSAATECKIHISTFYGGLDMDIKITRSKFEEICADLFNKTLPVLDGCLKCAKLDRNEIDEIILVGGSTRIPKIHSMLKDYFNNKNLNKSMSPDEVVAEGAGICAAMFQKNKSKSIIFNDVAPISLGIKIKGGEMDVIVPKNTQVPITVPRLYMTSEDNQVTLRIAVLEGEHLKADDNNVLGEFEITGFPQRQKGMIKFDVIFTVDDNGVLTIDCTETVTKIRDKLQISYDKGRLNQNEIQRMRQDNQKANDELRSREDAAQEKNKLYRYCDNMIKDITNKRCITDNIQRQCEDTIKWVDDNNAKTTKEYTQKYNEIKSFCDRFL